MTVGFAGLGLMGQPMALNLARAGTDLVVWNRSAGRTAPLAAVGARVAADVDELFAASDIVLLMLANARAVDTVLDRRGERFGDRVRARTIVAMGTTAPAYSQLLGEDVEAHGGIYVEAPVSGSRPVAEAGALIGMLAGPASRVATVRRELAPVCRQTFVCGEVPSALTTKLAVNAFLIAMVTGLAEAWSLARQSGVDLETFRAVLDSGPMASTVSRAKTALLQAGHFPAQAALADVLENSRLIVGAAQEVGAATPLIDACLALLADATENGDGALDMVAVMRTLADTQRAV